MTNFLTSTRLAHGHYTRAKEEMTERIALASRQGGVVPMTGPTRVGKSEILMDLRNDLGSWQQEGLFGQTCSFGIGSVAPRPNEKLLYAAMLQGVGARILPNETAEQARQRLLKLIADRGIKIIALDECSHCAERGANLSARAATDHFKSIVDATGIVLVLAGLPKLQPLIDGNEQLRDRAMRTVQFLPYQWSDDRDRDAFAQAAFSLIDRLEDHGHRLALDHEDLVRRLYGASGGRVGMIFRLLAATLDLAKVAKDISLRDIARADGAIRQVQGGLAPMFEDEPPTDHDLECSHARVIQEAGLYLSPTKLAAYQALRTVAG